MTTDDLLTQARAALAALEAERALARARHRESMSEYDTEAKRLRGAIRSLSGELEKRPRRQRSAAVQAGPKALNAVREVLAGGPMAQAQIVKGTGLNDGTVSYALRALVEAGEIEPTGAFVKGSREYAAVRRSRSVA